MRAIDYWLLSKFQKLSERIQDWTSWDCLHQAQVCCGGVALCILVFIVQEIMAKKGFDWFMGLVMMIDVAKAFFGDFGDNRVREQALEGLANFRKQDWIYRVFTLLLGAIITPIFWLAPVFAVWIGFVIAECYLSACDPKPPSKSKVMEWLRGLGEVRKVALATSLK